MVLIVVFFLAGGLICLGQNRQLSRSNRELKEKIVNLEEKIENLKSDSQKQISEEDSRQKEESGVEPELIREAKYQDGWKSYTNEETGVSFSYPREIDGEYVDIASEGWPRIYLKQIGSGIDCEERENFKTDFGYGKRESIELEGHNYCMTVGDEGAAGRVLSTYTYVTERFNRKVTLRFTLVYPNCDVYSEKFRAECQDTQENFSPHFYADSIIDTISISS